MMHQPSGGIGGTATDIRIQAEQIGFTKKKMAELINSVGVKPEIEVFDTGQIRLARDLIDKGFLKLPAMFQLCLGISWTAPATTDAMLLMRNMLPKDTVWAAFGISRHEFPMVAQAVILGGHVRVGFEDSVMDFDQSKLAPSNAYLVERMANLCNALGRPIATPAEARRAVSVS